MSYQIFRLYGECRESKSLVETFVGASVISNSSLCIVPVCVSYKSSSHFL